MSDASPHRLELRLAGPLVATGRLPLSELQRVADRLRTTLRDVAIVLSDHGPSGRAGRVKKVIERAVDLNVVGSPRKGSFVLDLETPSPAPSAQDELFDDFGPDLADRAVGAFVAGLAILSDDLQRLPEGFDRGVLRAISGFGQSFSRGIDKVSFTVTNGRPEPARARLTRDRVAIAKRLIRKPIQSHIVIEGSLRMVDDGTLECRVERPPNVSVTCFFDEKDRDAVWEAGRGRQLVRVVGEGEFHPGETEPRKVWASSIKMLFEALPFDPNVFWHHRDLDDLAKKHDGPRAPWAGLSDPWRDDAEAEALIAAIEGNK